MERKAGVRIQLGEKEFHSQLYIPFAPEIPGQIKKRP